MIRRIFLLIAIQIYLAGCVPALNPVGDTSSTATPPACQPSKTQKSENDFLEIQGSMKSEGEVWALLFFETAHTNEDEKIVWRITGEGDEFHAQAQSEDGTNLAPIWTEYHGGSNWHRPGQEWGTGFNFPKPGCWKITVTRGETTGEIALEVLDP
jgi:hypothetical protein